jgi:hypothetical protein
MAASTSGKGSQGVEAAHQRGFFETGRKRSMFEIGLDRRSNAFGGNARGQSSFVRSGDARTRIPSGTTRLNPVVQEFSSSCRETVARWRGKWSAVPVAPAGYQSFTVSPAIIS